MQTNGHPQSQTLNILLVEDNPGDVDLTKASLRRSKLAAKIDVARDGEEAMAFLNRTGPFVHAARPDLVLLDLNLPKKNGIEVLREIKESEALRQIPVVIMTSSHREEDVIRSYDLHANCYVTKPIDLEQFRTVVRAIEEFWFTIVKLAREPDQRRAVS